MAKVRIGKFEVDEHVLDRQHAKAVECGNAKLAIEPQAKRVSYDCARNRLLIELKNGATLLLPCKLLQGLHNAAPEDIAEVELGPRGASLHWEGLDQDFSLAGLLAGVFGTRAWMAKIGRRSRSVKSRVKVQMARVNGKRGATHKNAKRA